MKIAHVVEPFSSGVITSIIQLCSGLPNYEHIVIHGTRTSQDNLNGVKSRFPDETNFFEWEHAGREINVVKDIRAAISLFQILRKSAPDVVHLHSSKAGAIGRPIAKLLGIKNVIYSPQGAPFVRQDISKTTRRLYLIIEKFLDRICGKVVCSCKSEHEAYNQHGIPSVYVNNGIEITGTGLHSPTNKKVVTIGCAALATTQKNPKWFNEIAGHFEKRDDVKFLWIGDGELRNDLSSQNIEVTGWKDRIETAKLIKKIDIYLSTSGWEGLPFAVIEAMLNGSCLLLNDCVGNRDLARNNINGFQFSSTEEAIQKLTKLLSDKDQIRQLGEQSRLLCEDEFNAQLMCERFCKLYNEG